MRTRIRSDHTGRRKKIAQKEECCIFVGNSWCKKDDILRITSTRPVTISLAAVRHFNCVTMWKRVTLFFKSGSRHQENLFLKHTNGVGALWDFVELMFKGKILTNLEEVLTFLAVIVLMGFMKCCLLCINFILIWNFWGEKNTFVFSFPGLNPPLYFQGKWRVLWGFGGGVGWGGVGFWLCHVISVFCTKERWWAMK